MLLYLLGVLNMIAAVGEVAAGGYWSNTSTIAAVLLLCMGMINALVGVLCVKESVR